MHPRIRELYELIKHADSSNALNIETLKTLKNYGATRTEASITIHLGFGISAEEVDNYVLKTNIWDAEELNDVFYQTLKYLYQSVNEPGYTDDDNDSIKISL